MLEAPLSVVCDAGQMRIAELATERRRLHALGLPTGRVDQSIVHLRLGLETAAQLPVGADRDMVLGYLIETYGLLAALSDPLLRPLLPPISGVGATVQPRVLAINRRGLVANGKLLILGSRLVPATPSL